MYVDITHPNTIKFSVDGIVFDSSILKSNVSAVDGTFIDNTTSQANPINRPTYAVVTLRLTDRTAIEIDLNNGVPNHPTWLPTKAGYALALAAIQAWQTA